MGAIVICDPYKHSMSVGAFACSDRVVPYGNEGVVVIVYWSENACSRTRVPQWQIYMSIRIERHASRHTAPLNALLLNHALEVCDAILRQLTEKDLDVAAVLVRCDPHTLTYADVR